MVDTSGPTSTLATSHKQYTDTVDRWRTCRDAYKGQEWIKNQRVFYLPPTQGMAKLLGDGKLNWDKKGLIKYESYLRRAVFPESMQEMVRTAIGIMWNKDATIEVPKKLEYIKREATSEGESLQQLMRNINVEQLIVGRCGLLADLPASVMGQKPRPYFTFYKSERIINWDVGARGIVPHRMLNLVVLDESEEERLRDLSTSYVEKYLVLSIGNLDPNDTTGDFWWGRFRGTPMADGASGMSPPIFDQTQMKRATVYGSAVPFIPFTFINSMDISHHVSPPPHIELANLQLSTYMTSADFEQQMHNQAQSTLVVEGGDPDTDYAVGVGACLTPSAGNKAYFIGVDSLGLPEIGKHYQNKLIQLERRSGQMIDTRSLQRESGESLKTRLAAQTATLSMIAKACGWGVERGLRQMAVMVGANPDEVRVSPNVNFLNPEIFAKTLVELAQARTMGVPLSKKDFIRLMQERGLTTQTIEQVEKEMKEEGELQIVSGTPIIPGNGEPTVIEGESTKLAAKAKAAGGPKNPSGSSPRGKTRNPRSKSK